MEENQKFDALDVYLRQYQETAKRINEQIVPIMKQRNAEIQRALAPIIAKQEQWREITKSIRKQFAPIVSVGAEIFQRVSEVQEKFAPFVEQLQKNFRELPARVQGAVLLLGAHGWYFDMDMPMSWLWQLERALSEGNLADVDEALIEYFDGRLDEIEDSIKSQFPERKKLIKAAFNAHRRGEYDLSIPVLLAQTDGICKEMMQQHFFMKQDNKPRTAIYVEERGADRFMSPFLMPLAQTLPISMSERERPEDFNELNRHMVLHGESLDYGTKTNSLKAISLINYVSSVLSFDKAK